MPQFSLFVDGEVGRGADRCPPFAIKCGDPFNYLCRLVVESATRSGGRPGLVRVAERRNGSSAGRSIPLIHATFLLTCARPAVIAAAWMRERQARG